MSWIFITFVDKISITSWSSDKVGKGKSMCLCWFRSVCGTDEGQGPGAQIERWKGSSGRTQVVFVLSKEAVGIDGEAIVSEWTNFQGFSILCLLFKRSSKTWREGTSSPKSSKTGSSSCQCSMTLSGKQMMRIVSRMPRRSIITRWTSRKDIGHSWVQGQKRKESRILQPTEWYIDSKKLVILCSIKYQCLESWNPEAEER